MVQFNSPCAIIDEKEGCIMLDVILDTDTFNEIDDQFAIAYLLRSDDRLNTLALYAAPFTNFRDVTPAIGMEQSYQEIYKVLNLMDRNYPVLRGAEQFLPDENTPVTSDAALDLVKRAAHYSADAPLYVVAIGAITNIASAILLEPSIKEKIIVVWLGGNAHHFHDTAEFNMRQDIAAARVVMRSGVRFVHLPCRGVVNTFTISKPELEYWLAGKNPLADYLARNTIQKAESYAGGTPWTRTIWDVAAVAWLLNDDDRFMHSRKIPAKLPGYDNRYTHEPAPEIDYVYHVNRDALMTDLIRKLLQ